MWYIWLYIIMIGVVLELPNHKYGYPIRKWVISIDCFLFFGFFFLGGGGVKCTVARFTQKNYDNDQNLIMLIIF
jgi:hypothetical protein